MPELVLSHSLDGFVRKAERADDHVRVEVVVPFEHRVHFDYFLEAHKQGTIDFDLRSRIARLGYDIRFEDGKLKLDIDSRKKEISLVGFLYPWTDQFFPIDGEWQDLLAVEEFGVGKLVNLAPSLMVSRQDLETSIEENVVHLREGSTFLDDFTFIPTNHHIYVPNPELMTMKHLRAALTDVPRKELTDWQNPKSVSGITVPKDGGVVAHTSLRTGEFALAISREQKEGVRHTNAFYVYPHSTADLFLEFRGNGKHDVAIEGILAKFYRIDTTKVKSRVTVPELKLTPEIVMAKPYAKSFYVFRPSKDGFKRKIKISPSDLRNLSKFDDLLRNGQRNAAYYFYTFPSLEIVDILQSNAIHGKVGSLIFSEPPLEGEKFDSKYYNEIQRLSEYGVNVVWDSPEGRLFFHRVAFMKPEKRIEYDKAYSSNSIMAMFGSHHPLGDQDIVEFTALLEGFKRFCGGEKGTATIVCGGGPGSMTQYMHIAQSLGILTGSINILKRGESQAPFADFYFPFPDTNLGIRQENLIVDAGIFTFGPGGHGTLSEAGDVFSRKGFYRSDEPAFFLSSDGYFESLRNLFEEKSRSEDGRPARMNPDLLPHTRFLDKGSQFYPALLKHYGFQRKR
ncbi:MAG: hypothetical protein U9O94_06610 [Nanoarchaeota archaeon]|nr:hypothetical protein [Nanoarchaeota archaeon]